MLLMSHYNNKVQYFTCSDLKAQVNCIIYSRNECSPRIGRKIHRKHLLDDNYYMYNNMSTNKLCRDSRG